LVNLISSDHLEHWLKEIKYQLGGLDSKLASPDAGEDHSLIYINEKVETIRCLLNSIFWDMKHDEN